MPTLTIRWPSKLLNTETHEITEEEVSIIREVLADGGLTYGEFIAWQVKRAEGKDEEDPEC